MVDKPRCEFLTYAGTDCKIPPKFFLFKNSEEWFPACHVHFRMFFHKAHSAPDRGSTTYRYSIQEITWDEVQVLEIMKS